MELWEVQKYGLDSFSDPEYVCIYGMRDSESCKGTSRTGNMWNVDPAKPIYRVLFVLFGIMLLAFGLTALKTTLLSYRNSWGGLVFGPFAISFGLVFILGALFKPSIFK